jgi:predicted secreted protein
MISSRRSSSLLFVVALVLALFACVSACPAPKDNPAHFDLAAGAPVFTKADSQISVHAGDMFIIELPSNPTTGFTWMLAGDSVPDGLELLGCKYTRAATAPRIVGSGGIDSFAFKAARRTTHTGMRAQC